MTYVRLWEHKVRPYDRVYVLLEVFSLRANVSFPSMLSSEVGEQIQSVPLQSCFELANHSDSS